MDTLGTLFAKPDALLWAAVLAALAAAAVLFTVLWRRRAQRHQVQRVLRRLGGVCARDLIIPDGLGGSLQLDYLVLLHGGVLVLDVKNYRGALFGADNAPLWTQVVKSRSYKFDNPLPHNRLRAQTVGLLLPEVPVRACVVFTPDGQFPRGMPAGVSMLATLAGDLGAFAAAGAVPQSYRDAWERLLAQDIGGGASMLQGSRA